MPLISARDIARMNGTLAQLSNATIIEIAGPARLDSAGDPVGDPVVLWEGEARGFLQREEKAVTTNGVETIEDVDTLRVFEAEGMPTTIVAGADWDAYTVVIVDRRPAVDVTLRWTVRGMSWDHDGTLDSLLLELDAEVAA
jgi:hypothetical protein